MDPDANLVELRRLAHLWLYGDTFPHSRPDADDALRMAELVEALDEWISRGGFLPASWELGRRK